MCIVFARILLIKAILILLRILIDYTQKFPFLSEKEFRVGDIKVKHFGTLKNIFELEMGRKNIYFIIREFKKNHFLNSLCYLSSNIRIKIA